MAKQTSIIRLKGTIAGITFVKSTEYGDHTRTARGTHKKATLNEVFQRESSALQDSNLPAKILKDAIEPHREGFSGGQLWQRMVSMFRKQLKDDGAFDFAKLKPFELQEKYPFSRILNLMPTVTVDREQSKLDINLRHNGHARFNHVKEVDGYKLKVVGIFPDLNKKSAVTEVTTTDIIELDSTNPVQLQLPIPPDATRYVICVKIDGYFQERSIDTRASQGFIALAFGII